MGLSNRKDKGPMNSDEEGYRTGLGLTGEEEDQSLELFIRHPRENDE